jgi:hypothetical protein
MTPSLASVTMMERPATESRSAFSSHAIGSEPAGLLLSRDLIFTSKVKGTAVELGYSIFVAGNDSQVRSMIESCRPLVVFVDLTAGDLCAPRALVLYQEIAGPEVWFVAFGSHVDVNALQAARTAGCHVVLPRSRFAAELPALMRQYFSQPATRNDRGLASP